MGKLSSAQLKSLKTFAESHTKEETYRWINNNYTNEDKRKHAKQAARRWIRNANPKNIHLNFVPSHEDGPTGICEICTHRYHNTELQLGQLSHYDNFHLICNDCVRDLREREEYIILDFEYKQMTVSAGNPKKQGEHGKVNHVGAFSNTIRSYNAEDYPSRTKDTSDFNNYYDGDNHISE